MQVALCTGVRILVILVLLAACDRGMGPHAHGRLVFDVRPAAEADVFLATEGEVLRSEPVLGRVRENYRTQVQSSAVSVKRDPNTMILDVFVKNGDPQVAAKTCNQVMQVYVDMRMEMGLMKVQQQLDVLSEALDKTPGDADLQRRIKDLEIQSHMRETDVRVLEPCRAPG